MQKLQLMRNLKQKLNGCNRNLISREVDITIYTDASNTGLGGTNGVSSINGRWSMAEQNCHINELELLAIKFCLQFFYKDLCNKVICIMSDNAIAISYVNHMGGTKSARCNDIAREIWVLGKGTWISANHIPGQENTEADQMSCTFTDHTEWMLSDEIFKKICDIEGTPDIDLFANRLNHKVAEYASWKPDPESCFINAFSKNWKQFAYIYRFPPFSLIWKTLSKIRINTLSSFDIKNMIIDEHVFLFHQNY